MRDAVRRLVRDVRALLGRRRADAELDAELAFHIEMETARHVQSGVAESEARRRALVAFGGVERHREATLATRPARRADTVLRDLGQAVRLLRRSRAFSLMVVATVALGVGAATSMFSLADGVLLRPLVYGDAERLYNLFEARETGGIRQPSYPSFRDWEGAVEAFESMAYVRGDEFRLRGDDGTQRLLAGYVSDSFFRTVKADPEVGRTFTGHDQDTHVVVLSHELWQRRFGGDPDIVGSTVTTADATFTIVGVMPKGFRIPAYADVWAPIAALPPDASHALTRRDLHVDSEAWGLLRRTATVERARADLSRVVAGLAAQYPDVGGDWTRASLISAREQIVGDVGAQFRILTAAVALLLLIVCVNVAGLQLARGSARERELAVRTALGASRARLVRQLVAESLLLTLAGGALGALLAWRATPLLAQAFPFALPRLGDVAVDGRALLFALVASLLAALASGMLPALRSTAAGAAPVLGSRSGGTTVRSQRMRAVLVTAQVALALTLTVGSGLLLRSLWQLQRVDPGFEPDNLVTLRVFPPARYAEPEAALALYRELHQAVAGVTGVEAAALANHLPFAGGFMITQVLAGTAPATGGDRAIIRTVSEEYFDVMGTRRLRGRLLAAEDFTAVGGGVVINDVLARDFFGSDDPIGRSITIFHSAQARAEYGEAIHATIVGVVAAERFFQLEQDAPRAVFVPYTWMPWPNITLVARTPDAAPAPIAALRRAVQQIDVDIPVAGPSRQAEWRPLTQFMADRQEQRTLMAGLLTGFAGAALLLAGLGIFGVTAYLVARRRREIGIRAAIGASPRALAGIVIGHSLRLAAFGLLVGLPAAWGATRLLRSELFGVSAADPLTAAGAALTLTAATLLAAALPTWRALRIPPTEALRSD